MSRPTRDPHLLTYIKEGKTATYILLGFFFRFYDIVLMERIEL